MTEESLFHDALARPAAERAAFLDAACAEQPQLRAAVEALLAAHEASGSLLDRPLGELAQAGPGVTGAFTPEPAETSSRLVTTTAYSPKIEPGIVIGGRYTLQEKIGEGGMGEVWVAKQTEPVKRKVALKLIKAGMDSKAVLTRFEQERQALALMDHPNIARVLDGGLTPTGQPYFVMELVNGLALTKFCDEARLTPRERLELFVPICQAVQHAHQKGIVHRDLKPSNILVTLIDGKPVPRVIDFGLAKATGGKLTDESLSTQFGAVVGTLEYMSPEQAGYSSVDVDTRSDIYSLGVILYELLSGLRPLDAKRVKQAAFTEMIRIIKEEEPSKPSTRLSTDAALPSLAALRQIEPRRLLALLRGELDWVVMKCLEKSRERRYETANGLARDVQRYLADEAVEARPPSMGYQLKKFVQRHQGAVVAAGLVLLALMVGMVGTTWGLIRANAAADAERLAKQDADEKKRQAEEAAGAEIVAREQAQGDRDKALQAAAAEKQAHLDEERERKYAQGIASFVRDDFLALTSVEGQDRFGGEGKEALDRNWTLEQLLDRAAVKLNQRKDLDPRIEAELRWIIGVNYRGQGRAELAVPFLERCVALRKDYLGVDHPDTLDAQNSLAVAYFAAGQFAEAIALFEGVCDARAKQLGADHPRTFITLHNLAAAYQTVGRFAEAIALYERVRDAQVKTLGANHPSTLSTLHDLAVAYQAAGRLAEAIALLERVRDVQVKTLGADHLNTLSTLSNLAVAYQAAGRLAEAIVLFERVREGRVKQLGADHPNTLLTLHNLAATYGKAKQLDKSVPLYEELLKRQEAKLGRQHPSTQKGVANLGVSYKDAGRLEEAIPLLEEAYRASRSLPTLRWVAPHLIDGYLKAGMSAEARKLIEKHVEDVRKTLPRDSPQLAFLLARSSVQLLQIKAYADAEPLLRESLAIREKTEPDLWSTFNTKSMLGGALLGQQKYAEAEPLLLAGYDGMKQREAADPATV